MSPNFLRRFRVIHRNRLVSIFSCEIVFRKLKKGYGNAKDDVDLVFLKVRANQRSLEVG